jgi:NifB/MoaA-like Fe-S oxidoreductase
VSVHATNHETRKVLLNNPRVPDVLAQLDRLAAGGIRFHCQMVIVPGLNDEGALDESLRDLWARRDVVLTTAVVPVGLTQFSHLYTGRTMDREMALRILGQVERFGAIARDEGGDTWVFASDELYLLAGRELPGPEHYGDFAQIENGVGAVTSLRMRVGEGLDDLPRLDGRRIGVVTGLAMAPLMPGILTQLAGRTGAEFELIVAENSLFGRTTTTAGLLVGADMKRALNGRSDLDLALIPAETINDDGVFLDDVSFAALSSELPVRAIPSYDFVDVLSAGVGDLFPVAA